MKAFVRLSCLTFALTSLFVLNSTAINLEDAVNWWLKNQLSIRNSLERPAQVGLRSTSAKKFRIDSILMISPDTATLLTTIPQKIEFLYDETGNRFSQLRYEKRDDSLSWNLEDKTVFTYDAQNGLHSDTVFTRNTDTGNWFPSEIQENRFDAQGHLLMEESRYRYNESDSWKGDYKRENQLDERGKMLSQLSYTYSKDNIWEPLAKRICLNNGLRDTAWYNYQYDSPNQSWTLESKESCLYDSSGHNNLRLIRRWNNDSLSWTIRRKIDFAYDERGNKIKEYAFDLDTTTNEWIRDGGEEWAFDEFGNVLSNTNVMGKDSWIFWGLTTKTEYQYDYSIPVSLITPSVYPLDYPVFNLVKGGSLYLYMPPLDSWYEAAQISIHYSDLEQAIETSTLSKTAPWFYDTTSHCLLFDPSVNLATVHLYDMQGIKVRTFKGNQHSLFGLAKGIYVIRMVSGGSLTQGKVVVN